MQRTDTPQAASTPGEAWRGCVRDPPLDVSLAAVVLVCVAVSLLALRIPLLHRRWLWPPAREYRHTAQDPSSSAARKYVESRIELFGDERSHWFLACLIMYLACGELVSVPVVDGLLQKAFGELWLSKAKCGAGLHALSTVYRLVGRGRQLQATGQPGGWAKWGLEDNPVGMATGLATSAYGVYEFVHRCALIYARWLNQQEAKFHTKGGIELADESIDPDYPAAAAAFRRALTFGRSAQLDEEQYRDIQIRVSRAEFNAAGFGDRVNFSLNSLDDHGKFQLRTLAELDVKALFPSPYIYEHVLPLAKQTVKGGEHYPFVQISLPGSASQQVRELKKQPDLWGPETEGLRQQQGLRTLLGQLVMSEIDTNRDGEVDRQEAEKYVQAEEELRSQVVKKLRDQLVNVISKDFSSGHVSEDIGSKQLKEEYVFGVTYEVSGASVSRKFRCLLVQKKLLTHLCAGAQYVPSGPEGYRKYCLGRWAQLGTLKRLFELRTDDVLVGSVSLVVPGGQQQVSNEFRTTDSGRVYRAGSPGAAAATALAQPRCSPSAHQSAMGGALAEGHLGGPATTTHDDDRDEAHHGDWQPPERWRGCWKCTATGGMGVEEGVPPS